MSTKTKTVQYQNETMTIAQAKEAISSATKLYFAQTEQGKSRVPRRRQRPLCLMGPAGIGKTEIVAQVAKEQDLALCSYSLVHHTRQSLLGLPRLETHEILGEEASCTRYTMSEIIDEIHQEMARTGKEKGILFLDEFNCVNESIRPVMLQLLQDKSLGTHEIPQGWMIVLAGNPTIYNKSAKDLDAVTMDRVRIMQLAPDLDAWLPYARTSGVHPVVISFLTENPKYFYQHQSKSRETQEELVTPRAWEDMSIQLEMMEEFDMEVTPSFLSQFFQSPTLVHSFFLYYRRYAVVSGSGLLDKMFQRDLTSITQISSLGLQDRWALNTAVISRIKTYGRAIEQQEKRVENIHEILEANRRKLKGDGEKSSELLYELAQGETDREVSNFLINLSGAVDDQNTWKQIESYFHENITLPLEKERESAMEQLDNGIFIFNEAFKDAENAERLINSITADEGTAKLILSGTSPAYQELCLKTQFKDSQDLKELLLRKEVV